MNKISFLLFLLTICGYCNAQVDTEFWFAPPEVTSGHGDLPIYLRVSSQDKPATIRVLQPAVANPEVITFSIAANTTRTITLSGLGIDIESKPPATVLKTGLHIISSTPITAYYEVGSTLNGEIFVLKGRNAIGNKFMIIGQDYYDNSPEYTPLAYASFDIVATEDNTIIKVKPTHPVVGFEGKDIIVIRLNAGETYSFKKPTQSAKDNFTGTVVESSKPIAVTIKDDSVINSTCRDLLGDQIIPVNVTGKEYIVLKGSLADNEFAYVMATENNTKVFLSGINVPVKTLNAGQYYRVDVTLLAVYIKTDKPVYVLHVTGFGCEVAMAVLPPVTCTGSKQIAFTRSTNEFFEMNILVKKEGIYFFKLNGSSNLITPNKFIPVPGTNDEWYSAQIPFTTAQIPDGEASVISNDQFSFQAGILNGNAGTTNRYGFFSSFSTLFIGDDFSICNDQTAMLDAGPGKETYLWSTGETTQRIEVSKSGDYWVRVGTQECVLSDTIRVNVRKGFEDLGPDLEICEGDTAKIDGQENFSWQWSDGTIGQYLETTVLGKYWVTVLDQVGCLASDTIEVKRLVHEFDPAIKANLNVVSIDTATQSRIHLHWIISEPELLEVNKVFLYKRQLGTEEWNLEAVEPGDKISLEDRDSLTNETSFEYYLGLANPCGKEQLTSKIHNTILLKAEADSISEMISFSWNAYKEWDTGVKNYELWRKLDDNNRYQKVADISNGQNNFSAKLTGDGFTHQYVVRAVDGSERMESWSNAVTFKFDHPIVAPNVFTPNGDAHNQYFVIKNIELYKNSHLEIVDRWGKKVFEATGYLNNWDGDGLSTGVYFYVLDLKTENNTIIKGPVSLLR